MARAIWKGRLCLGAAEVPVKLYSAVEDRGVHFRLLHAPEKQPVVQEWVDKSTGEALSASEIHKAYGLEDGSFVLLSSEDLQQLEPQASRGIDILRFVDPAQIDHRYYDRPYYLGPDGDGEGYFALVQALAERKLEGLTRWVMRKKSYLGALREQGGYLVMISLRHAGEVVDVEGLAQNRKLDATRRETELASKLVEALEGPFEPEEFGDEYRARLLELIDKKARGETVAPPRVKKAKPPPSLTDALASSLSAAREKKSA